MVKDGFTHQGTALPMSTAGMFGHTFVAAKTDRQSGVVVLPNPREIGHRLQIINPVGCQLKTENNDNNACDRYGYKKSFTLINQKVRILMHNQEGRKQQQMLQ